MRPGQTQNEFLSAFIHFLLMRLHDTGLTMNLEWFDFVSVAGPRGEILVPA